MGSAPCGPQKLDQTDRLPELRERTPLLWGTTGGYQNPCRSFAEVSYALLCTVMQFATDVTAKNNVNSRTWARNLRTRGSWVQVLPGAPNFKDLAAKTKSSSRLWDRCGTSYPPVRAAWMEFKHLACKTRSSFVAVGPCGTSNPHVRAGHRRRVTLSVCRFGREADSHA